MAKRGIPEVNAGSMADIAFLLLIFFIVATTMEKDTGLLRMLPKLDDSEQNEPPPEIKKRNLFIVLVNRNDQLLIEEKPGRIEDVEELAIEFLINAEDRDDLPEKEKKNIDLIGEFRVPKGVISLQNDRGTSYGTYIEVQNKLISAGNKAKDIISEQEFGKKFDELTIEQQDAIKIAMPVMISEAEPRQIN